MYFQTRPERWPGQSALHSCTEIAVGAENLCSSPAAAQPATTPCLRLIGRTYLWSYPRNTLRARSRSFSRLLPNLLALVFPSLSSATAQHCAVFNNHFNASFTYSPSRTTRQLPVEGVFKRLSKRQELPIYILYPRRFRLLRFGT
jgi:hypothetical protein